MMRFFDCFDIFDDNFNSAANFSVSIVVICSKRAISCVMNAEFFRNIEWLIGSPFIAMFPLIPEVLIYNFC